jgi:hypothetical protein
LSVTCIFSEYNFQELPVTVGKLLKFPFRYVQKYGAWAGFFKYNKCPVVPLVPVVPVVPVDPVVPVVPLVPDVP